MLEAETVVFGLMGGLGGILRICVGLRKAQLQKRKFIPSYFLITLIISVFSGAILGSIIGTSKIVALLIGYAGTDLLESAAKSLKIVPIKTG